MARYTLYYTTNRGHVGADRWSPDSYGPRFSSDGRDNLRFGRVEVEADAEKVSRHLGRDLGEMGAGDGEKLAGYLAKQVAKKAKISAFAEKLFSKDGETPLKRPELGSSRMFDDLQQVMRDSSDVLIYIHGYNVSWEDAVGSALALQIMLENQPGRDSQQKLALVLFTWPSDGQALPIQSYRSDRSDAEASGEAVGRALLKARDYLAELRDRARGGQPLCGQDIHLLCHSMGNYLLQNAVQRIDEFSAGAHLPRMFEHIFLCAADVDDDVLEPGRPLGKLHGLARCVTVYHNREDRALTISDYTKGNPERLGGTGAARPALVHNKVHQVDCTAIVSGVVEHSYYLSGRVNADIRASIDRLPLDEGSRGRRRDDTLNNVWRLV